MSNDDIDGQNNTHQQEPSAEPPQKEPPATDPQGTPDSSKEPNPDELTQLRTQNEESLKRAQAAEENLAQARAELAEARMESARLRIRSAYPQISDNALTSLAPTDADPERLEAWAKAYAAELDKIQPASADQAPPQRTPGDISNNIRGNGMPHPPAKQTHGTAESGYEYGRKFAVIDKK